MAALPLLKYAIRELYLFPWYATREQYLSATGTEAPPFDPTRPPKYWYDAEAARSIKRVVSYEYALAVDDRGAPLAGPDGKPYLQPLLLPRGDAATVNIPSGLANEPGTDQPPVMDPMRALAPEEELIFEMGGVLVHNKSVVDTTIVGFSAQDRALLFAIARKLNVNVG